MAFSVVAFFIMGTITALTKQKRNPDRINVFIDGTFAFGLAALTAVSLRVGQTITEADIQALQQTDQLENAKQTAVRFISYRPRSLMEVRRNLRDKGYDEHTIDQAVTRLQEVDLLNDHKFAEYWVEQRETFKPRSQMALRQELQQKGISREIIDRVIEHIDETDAARQAAQKQLRRWRNLPQEQFTKKLGAYLQRRGFSYAIIREISDEIWQMISSDSE